MKISDTFYCPLPLNQMDSIEDVHAYALAKCEDDEIAKVAAHAINCHDELVEALTSIENDDGCIPSAIWELRNKALAKARGEV